jgi:hypothetical protein
MVLEKCRVRYNLFDFIFYSTQQESERGDKMDTTLKEKSTLEVGQLAPYIVSSALPICRAIEPRCPLTLGLEIFVLLADKVAEAQPECHKLSPNATKLLGGILNALVKAKVLSHCPDRSSRLTMDPSDEISSTLNVTGYGLLAENMLACCNGFLDDSGLDGNRQTGNDGRDVVPRQKIVD